MTPALAELQGPSNVPRRTVGYAHGAPGPFVTRKPLVHITPGWRSAQAYCGVWLRQRFTEGPGQMTPEPTCKKCLRAVEKGAGDD